MAPKKPYAKTKLKGGPATIIKIAEGMRTVDTDGYLCKTGFLWDVRFGGTPMKVTKAVVCSPFTGSVCGVAFDPEYPRTDGKPYVPMFNGGADPLPYAFYTQHNDNDQPAQSLPAFNLGEVIKPEKMRRGDVVGIDWVPPPGAKFGGGHAVFVWDVHLNAKGDVDCFQMLGSHGSLAAGGWGYGVHISGCHGPRWFSGKPAKQGQHGTGSLSKAKDPVFVDEDEIVRDGTWYALPNVKVEDIKLDTFRVRPVNPISKKILLIKVGRFWYDEPQPAPFCMKDGPPAPPPSPAVAGHAEAPPITTIKKAEVKKDPDAIKKVEPKPAKQDEKKPVAWQHDVELAMRDFFRAKWIDADPGESENINDAKSQAAIKAFQKKFKLDVDGIVGKFTKAMIKKQLPACHTQQVAEDALVALFKGGKLKSDPGEANGVNDAQTAAAVKEFQSANGLAPTGVPDAETQEKLKAALADHAPTDAKHGLNPLLLVSYWLGNVTKPGGSKTLRVHSFDVRKGLELEIFLKDAVSGKEVPAAVKLKITGDQSEASVPVPADFGDGAIVFARVKATDGGKTLELVGPAPLFVRGKAETADLETFFKFTGDVGESNAKRDYTYIGYRVKGKPQAWLIRGRFMTDVDGAPNCYHPNDLNVRLDYQNFDLESHTGALDWKRNGGHPGNWFGVVTDTGENTGTPVIQGAGDPFPGFYVSSTSLHDKNIKNRNNPKRYVDARIIPYIAFPGQIYSESGPRFTRLLPGHTGRIGDIVTVINPKADEAHRYAHAIFADMGGGNDPHFGEGSPALGKKIKAHGFANPDLVYIVYPHSGADQGTIPTAAEIHEKGEKLFNEWGGISEATRVIGLMAK